MNKFEELLERFDGLLNRFEGGSGSATATSATGGGQATTSESAKPTAAKPTRLHKAVKGFDSAMNEKIAEFLALAEKHSNKKILEASKVIKEMFDLIRNIIHAVTMSKGTKAEVMGEFITPHCKSLDKKLGKFLRDPDIKNHVKALLDSLQLIQLPLMHDPHDMGKEFLAQIDFFGNKVLMMRVEQETKWYEK